MSTIQSRLKETLPQTARVSAAGMLELAGLGVDDLVRRYGTPLYVYDELTVRQQCRLFKRTFEKHAPGSKVSYSAKAFANPTLFRIVNEEGLGLDVVSRGELEMAKKVRFPAAAISLHGNNKTRDDLESAVAYGVGTVVVDGVQEIQSLTAVAIKHAVRQKILLRVSPAVDPNTHRLTSTGRLDSKFGFTLGADDNAETLLAALNSISANQNLELCGIHFHLGSPLFTTKPYKAAIERVIEFTSKHDLPLKVLNTGGGFAAAHTTQATPPSVDEYAATISESLARACAKYGRRKPLLAVETGRALVARAAVALYTVGEIKEVRNVRNFVAVDGGMGDNIRPALYQAKYGVLLANRLSCKPKYRCTIAGRYCESGDLLATDVLIPYPKQGDIVALTGAGAYCLTMSSNYNMVPRPAAVMVAAGRTSVLCDRETQQQMLERHH